MHGEGLLLLPDGCFFEGENGLDEEFTKIHHQDFQLLILLV